MASALARTAGCWLTAAVALAAAALTNAAAQDRAQPEIALEASCSELREAVDRMAAEDGSRLQLSVAGRLTAVEFDGAVTYLAVCDAPHPKVLCIAYGTNGFQVGDMVVLSGGVGGYRRADADHILLDPCLPSAPPA